MSHDCSLPSGPDGIYPFDAVAYSGSDAQGQTRTLLKNAHGTRGASLVFNVEQLPCFSVWKDTAAAPDGSATRTRRFTRRCIARPAGSEDDGGAPGTRNRECAADHLDLDLGGAGEFETRAGRDAVTRACERTRRRSCDAMRAVSSPLSNGFSL